jgi:hypothetical protein
LTPDLREELAQVILVHPQPVLSRAGCGAQQFETAERNAYPDTIRPPPDLQRHHVDGSGGPGRHE